MTKPPGNTMRAPVPLPRIDDLDVFYSDFFLAARPVVVAGAARRMPAFERWTDAYLIETFGDTRPLVRLADGRQGLMRLTDFLDYLAAPEGFLSSTGPAYLTDFYVRPAFQDRGRERLGADAAFPLPRGDTRFAEWISIYAGPPGTSTPIHQDIFSTHTWLAALRGEKTWRLCAPEAHLGYGSVDAFGEHDIGCDVHEAHIGPGDVIYLPPNWWHQVKNESSSTLALSGNFCTFSQARVALAEALAIQDPDLRKRSAETWQAILALEESAA